MIDTHIPEDDLVLFALQLLPEERMRQAKKHAETCDLCRGEIAKLQGDLVAYSMTADFHAPPPAARDRFMRQIAKEPKLAPLEPEPEPERRPAPAPAPPPLTPLEDRRATQAQIHAASEPFFPTRQSRALGRTIPEDELEVPPERRRRGLHRGMPEDEPEVPKERRRPSRAPWVLAWTGWAVAAGASFVAGLQLHQRQQIQSSIAAQQARMDDATRQAAHARDVLATITSANAMEMPLHLTAAVKAATPVKPGTAPTPAAAPSAEALVAYLADKGALVFIGTHMEPAPAGKTYELWLLPANGGNPMPAGTFKPDAQGTARIVMPQLPKGVAAKGFGVTVENDGGSETPTLPIVMS
ncbi:MAG TPA: anti-sigma factor [Acidobacteriaceae bacterium]|nr:anti-sigma factor [Acidobacteriaceae bacterium]